MDLAYGKEESIIFEEYPDVVRPKELQVMLCLGRTKAYKLIKSGEIPSKKIGGTYFIRKIDIINLVNPENK